MPRRPLEILNVAAVLALAGIAGLCAAAGRLPGWPEVFARYALMLVFLLVVSWLTAREEKPGRALRLLVNFYPMAVIPLIYESLGVLIPALRGPSRTPGSSPPTGRSSTPTRPSGSSASSGRR